MKIHKRSNDITSDMPKGRAFKKPTARTFKNDAEIVAWTTDIVTREMEEPDSPLACFMVASTVVGPDERRLARMFHIDAFRAAEWAKNLRENGVWRQNGEVMDECWIRDDIGMASFCMDGLVALGLAETPFKAAAGVIPADSDPSDFELRWRRARAK